MNAQCYPSMLSDIRRTKEAEVVEENSLHQFSHVHADAELALVCFENGENPSTEHAKCRMAEADGFLGIPQGEAGFSELL